MAGCDDGAADTAAGMPASTVISSSCACLTKFHAQVVRGSMAPATALPCNTARAVPVCTTHIHPHDTSLVLSSEPCTAWHFLMVLLSVVLIGFWAEEPSGHRLCHHLRWTYHIQARLWRMWVTIMKQQCDGFLRQAALDGAYSALFVQSV